MDDVAVPLWRIRERMTGVDADAADRTSSASLCRDAGAMAVRASRTDTGALRVVAPAILIG